VQLLPRLIDVDVPLDPVGAVLVLHGGASRRRSARVSPTQLSVLRMVPIAARIARAGRGRLAVYRLLNSARGWDTHHTPVKDTSWALEELASRHGEELPVCLVGHSLGGRAALLSADAPAVKGVVALAPWVYPNDGPEGPVAARILIVHGNADRVASPERSAALARRLSGRAQVSYVTVEGGKHAMLARHNAFEGLATEFVTTTLLDDAQAPDPRRLVPGRSWITV
jgi:alpha-beta hydrolase superfamily lysophospholipase